MAVIGDRILRCRKGHLFVSGEGSRLFASVHLGPARMIRCPVDGKFGLATNVRESSLTADQLEEARQFHT